MADRRIEYVPLSSLKADPRNPKSHDLGLIDASYDRFGVVDTVTTDGRTGYIISGHGRTTALRDAFANNQEPPEGVRVDEATGEWLVPVNTGWSSKNDAEAAAALIAMNRVTEMGGWVDQTLLDLLDDIEKSGAGFEGVGYSDTDLDDLRHLLEDVPDLDALADEYNPDTAGGGGAKAVTVKLSDPGLIDLWHSVRDTVKTDDEAARILFKDAPAAPIKTAKSRAADPTTSDIMDMEDALEAPVDDTIVVNGIALDMTDLAPDLAPDLEPEPEEEPIDETDETDDDTFIPTGEDSLEVDLKEMN
jgi:hypothetical protein